MFGLVDLLLIVQVTWVSGLPRLDASSITSRSKSSNFSSYAPVYVECPERSQWVRPAFSLSDEEAVWVKGRKVKVLTGLKSYLERLEFEDFDLDEYIKRIECDAAKIPTIGMAISGGGWSSAMTGTGALRALDDRFQPAVEQRTGGIIQSMTYFSGLSGGSWPVMSLATHNFPRIDEMVATWHTPKSTLGAQHNTKHRADVKTLFDEIYPKFAAGFNVSWSDLEGRAFAWEFVAGQEGGMETMVSDIAQLSSFKDHEMPFPMWQASESRPSDQEFFGLKIPSYNATMYEWSPLEFGAWQGMSSFFPTKYLDTTMKDGHPVDQCVVGFDRASFMLGLAADAANLWFIQAYSNGTIGSFSKRDEAPVQFEFPFAKLKAIQAAFKQTFNYTVAEDVYATVPNPFATTLSVDNNSQPPQNLTLLDSSEAGQSLPLWSQIQPARNVDFMIAWDAEQDSSPYSWNNGTNMYDTSYLATDAGLPFPKVPHPATFVNRGYTNKPTLFGCEANLTNTGDLSAPIVAYMPNAPYSAYTNYSWLQDSFSQEQMSVILTNGFNYVTQGNSTLDKEWPECLGCVAIDRSLNKVRMKRTERCQRCMTRYCWDGIEDNSTPGVVDLSLRLKPDMSFAEWNKSVTASYWPEIEN